MVEIVRRSFPRVAELVALAVLAELGALAELAGREALAVSVELEALAELAASEALEVSAEPVATGGSTTRSTAVAPHIGIGLRQTGSAAPLAEIPWPIASLAPGSRLGGRAAIYPAIALAAQA